jgi:hypothetical protein
MDNNIDMNQQPPLVKTKKHNKSNVWWAMLLILAGVILLVQNLHLANISFHWWALFIFLPVFGSLSSAWSEFQDSGRFNSAVRNKLGSAIVVGTVGVILMFGMDWGRFWPLMVIAGGLAVFLGGLSIADPQTNTRLSVWTAMGAWIGLAAMVLGIGFLAKTLPIAALQTWLAAYPTWWAVTLIVAGAGILLNAVILLVRNQGRMNWETWSMLLIAVFVLAAGVMAFFNLDWNLLFPVVLIACGVMVLAGIFRKR